MFGATETTINQKKLY